MSEPCQGLHNQNTTCTSLCVKEQFGNLGAKLLSLADFITLYLRWPSACYDFSAAKPPVTLTSENKTERVKILFVPKNKCTDKEDPCQGTWESNRKPSLTRKGDA